MSSEERASSTPEQPLNVAAAPPLSLLEALWHYGVLSPLDYHFALCLGALGPASEEVSFCAALASRAVQLGHVCLDLRTIPDLRFVELNTEARALFRYPAPERLLAALRASPLCSNGERGSSGSGESSNQGERPTPLVLDAQGRLYLQRYFGYEQQLAQELLARARPAPRVDLQGLREGLERWFPRASASSGSDSSTAQAGALELAACVAALQGLAVICGGPGTGKTTTVVKILALLQEQALREGAPLGILLLAPTGKAAQRLASSVSNGLDQLALPEAVKASIPREASTIHRALGGGRGSSGRFRHDASNPLSADVVVVDEVSMVDLMLLYQLVSAIRPAARLILQGDKDQLASVEAGAILGDIYDPAAAETWSVDFARRVQEVTGQTLRGTGAEPGLCDSLVHLEQSHRYPKDSGIGQLARAINRGDADTALRLLEWADGSGDALDCQRFDPGARTSSGEQVLERLTTAGYAPFIASVTPADKLARLEAYRVLCAHRQGARGVEQLNLEIERWLTGAGLIEPRGTFYENRPILITRNDYGLGLFNGDVGVVVQDHERRLRVCFAGSDGLRFFAPSRLPPHETVFAMTIHKSQGSEFDAVSVVLPDVPSPLVSRELLYTALTRARRRVDLFASGEVIRASVGRAVQRASGLHDALWQRR